MRPRWLLEALGAALLLVLPFFVPLLLPDGNLLLHSSLALRHPLYGVLIDFAAAAILGLIVLFLAPRLSPLLRTIVSSLLAGLIIWWFAFVVADGASKVPFLAHFAVFFARAQEILFQLCLTIPMFFIVFGFLKPNTMRSIVRRTRLGLAAFAFSGLWIIPKLIYLASLHPVQSFNHSPAGASPSPHKRIVWILFDELSYDIVFDRPVLDLKFPNLERLKSQSVSFADIQPAGSKTEEIIPALLAGRKMDKIRASSNGTLIYFDDQQNRWSGYDPNTSLFGTARDYGWNPGIAGWYNPYCRMFASVLTACSWRPGIQDLYPLRRLGASSSKTSFQNALIIPMFFFDVFFSSPDGEKQRLLRRNIRDYQALVSQAQKLIQDDPIRFVFLHLPVPHPPGFYNRATHQLCSCGSYFDNLVLADDLLGQLEEEIRQTPAADQTTLIVSSDHSWRIGLWKGGEFWTPEEEQIAATHRIDTRRPVFLVHFPGQQSSIDITAQQPELIEHDIIASMLQNKLQSPDDLVSFLHATQQNQQTSIKP